MHSVHFLVADLPGIPVIRISKIEKDLKPFRAEVLAKVVLMFSILVLHVMAIQF